MEQEDEMPISANQPAPSFNLPDQDGQMRSLEEFRGKPVVLYFYPKDDTPGCTTEACNFRDDYHIYQQHGVVILGISPDSAKSHTKFINKFNLPFTLLADEGHQIAEAYGVWGPKKFMGKEYEGVYRTTFLIGPDGDIVKVFENVKPDGHSGEVLAALAEKA
jgi:thioredoxin-dependent peroxiredoxin